ncbi:50S ribosomal protein L9 [Buchnera aphidicola (Thelaxes californica)]|uniref:Large ribosomal subunit protein bL9 n=1 Tax=Buchnera aphidicola (Thelaxes californica) TaxID=1315998 RepID=A0A4D6YAB0_9GAMM|nr:50S ribosomal protein L9 [Buchnera aphidicola]QCI26956.1 50S ribosomal protein L9 [Buchnera aphidicola (Thelaxes californica)]
MKVILISKVYNIGLIGDEVEVNAGYARNFLIPSGKAVIANKKNLDILHEQRKQKAQESYNKFVLSKAKAEKIKSLQPIIIFSKSGEGGKLFGSIGIRDIIKSIRILGIKLNKSDFKLPSGTLRTIGEHVVLFNPHKDVCENITLKIVSER